ncbi:hypothetical protein D3C81_2293600 [compost metagenome]
MAATMVPAGIVAFKLATNGILVVVFDVAILAVGTDPGSYTAVVKSVPPGVVVQSEPVAESIPIGITA